MKNRDITTSGFTLVEMAIVMVVVGLLLGTGMSLIGPLTDRAKTSEGREALNVATTSIAAFAATNNRIPAATEFAGVAHKATDPWQGAYQYIAASPLTSGAPPLCGYRSTQLTVNVCNDAACSSPTVVSNVAFVIVSRGANRNNQTAGSQIVTTVTTVRVYPAGIGIDGYSGGGDPSTPTDEYDDIVSWVTLDELRAKAGCQGPPLKLLNNDLPPATVGSAYAATFTADGGVPFTAPNLYRWCVQTTTGMPPTGLAFTPAVFSTNCGILAEAAWGNAAQLTVTGTPLTAGTAAMAVFVRDNNDSVSTNDNIIYKPFVLTINP